jgi:hypothetical protein
MSTLITTFQTIEDEGKCVDKFITGLDKIKFFSKQSIDIDYSDCDALLARERQFRVPMEEAFNYLAGMDVELSKEAIVTITKELLNMMDELHYKIDRAALIILLYEAFELFPTKFLAGHTRFAHVFFAKANDIYRNDLIMSNFTSEYVSIARKNIITNITKIWQRLPDQSKLKLRTLMKDSQVDKDMWHVMC